MTDLADTLDSLHDTDVIVRKLNDLAQDSTQDAVDRVNLEALAKRRGDLERQLGALLRADQLDLVEYRIEVASGDACPAVAVAQALLRFQEMTTCIFDALRTAPKRLYRPSPENVELSTMMVAGARVGSVMISLSVPNERLIAIQSDLDVAFELVFALLRVRSQNQLISVQARTGTAALSRAYAWAQNSVEHGLTTLISWQKNSAVSEAIAISKDDALLLQKTIEDTVLERTDDVERECELLSLDNASSSFVLRMPTGEELAGLLANSFPRGAWAIHARYLAALSRRLRVRCSTGEETARWTLNALTPYN
jgi:hypothetical protein